MLQKEKKKDDKDEKRGKEERLRKRKKEEEGTLQVSQIAGMFSLAVMSPREEPSQRFNMRPLSKMLPLSTRVLSKDIRPSVSYSIKCDSIVDSEIVFD